MTSRMLSPVAFFFRSLYVKYGSIPLKDQKENNYKKYVKKFLVGDRGMVVSHLILMVFLITVLYFNAGKFMTGIPFFDWVKTDKDHS